MLFTFIIVVHIYYFCSHLLLLFTFIIVVNIYYCCSHLLLLFAFIIVVHIYYCRSHLLLLFLWYFSFITSVRSIVLIIIIVIVLLFIVWKKKSKVYFSAEEWNDHDQNRNQSRNQTHYPHVKVSIRIDFISTYFFMIIIYISLLYYAFTITLYVVAIIKFFHSCTIYILWWLLFIYHRFETHDTSRRVQTCVRIESEMWLNDALLSSTRNFQFTSSVIETIHNQTNQCVRYITPFIQINSVSISYLDTNVHST